MNPSLLKQINETEDTRLKILLAITGLTTEQMQQVWTYLQSIKEG